MKQPVSIGSFASIETAASAIAADVPVRVAALAKEAAGNGATKCGIRWEAVIPETEPLAWLNHHDNLVRMYCSNRERLLRIAAIGVADMLRFKDGDVGPRQALDYVFACLKELPSGTRYYGGMRFHDDGPSDDLTWRRFGRVRFALPSIEVIRDDTRTILAANLVHSADIARDTKVLLALLGQMRTPPPLSPAHLPAPVKRVNNPDRERWELMMSRARQYLTSGELSKIVLARRCVFDFGEPLHPMALLLRLHEASPDSFHFCFNHGNEIAFIGATPERLYQRIERSIQSEALAGTRPRGATDEDDRWLESDLLASGKERDEHAMVVQAVRETLTPFCESLTHHEQPDVLKLRYVQHLRTLIHGHLKEGVTDADLLLALHPTPAVGGVPKDTAIRHIVDLEPFDRGWYTAPIGWAMEDQVEFAVAIRCALIEGSTLSLYSGAGIMPQSDTEQEWREIESKISNFVRILTS